MQRVGNLVSNFKLELKRVPRHTDQITEPPQGGGYSLNFVVVCCAEEEKLGDKRESLSRKLIRSHEGKVTRTFKNKITFNDERVETTKTPRPTKPSNLISVFLLPLVSWQCQLRACLQGRLGRNPEIAAARVDRGGELRHVPEGGAEKIVQYPEGGIASVDCEGDPTKSGYLAFDPGVVSIINWRQTGGQVSESSRYPRFDPSSDPSQKPTGSSAIPIPEESCKSFGRTPILGEYHPTKGPNRLAQPESSAVDLDESSSMPSVKVMDPDEASPEDLQVGESDNVINSRSWKYLTEFMLDVIRSPEGWMQEIPTPQHQIQTKTQEARPAAWQADQLHDFEIQVEIQV